MPSLVLKPTAPALWQARDDFRPDKSGRVWGDSKLAMASLLESRLRGSKIDLIYIDPPFDVGAKTRNAALLPGLCATGRIGSGRRVEGGGECIC